MLALVMSALAPTLAHAWVAAADEGQWIEVCSASGMVWLKADGLDDSAPGSSDTDMPMADMGSHCPWSGVHAPMAGLLPAATLFKPVPTDRDLQPVRSGIHRPGQALRASRARGPPSTS